MNSYESEPEAFIYFKIKLELWAIHSALSCIDSITPPLPSQILLFQWVRLSFQAQNRMQLYGRPAPVSSTDASEIIPNHIRMHCKNLNGYNGLSGPGMANCTHVVSFVSDHACFWAVTLEVCW